MDGRPSKLLTLFDTTQLYFIAYLIVRAVKNLKFLLVNPPYLCYTNSKSINFLELHTASSVF